MRREQFAGREHVPGRRERVAPRQQLREVLRVDLQPSGALEHARGEELAVAKRPRRRRAPVPLEREVRARGARRRRLRRGPDERAPDARRPKIEEAGLEGRAQKGHEEQREHVVDGEAPGDQHLRPVADDGRRVERDADQEGGDGDAREDVARAQGAARAAVARGVRRGPRRRGCVARGRRLRAAARRRRLEGVEGERLAVERRALRALAAHKVHDGPERVRALTPHRARPRPRGRRRRGDLAGEEPGDERAEARRPPAAPRVRRHDRGRRRAPRDALLALHLRVEVDGHGLAEGVQQLRVAPERARERAHGPREAHRALGLVRARESDVRDVARRLAGPRARDGVRQARLADEGARVRLEDGDAVGVERVDACGGPRSAGCLSNITERDGYAASLERRHGRGTPAGAALDDEVEALGLAVLERRDGLARRDRHPGGAAAPQHARDLPRRHGVEAPLRERQREQLALAETHGRRVEVEELDDLRGVDARLQKVPEREDEHRRPLEQEEHDLRHGGRQRHGLQPIRVHEEVDQQRAALRRIAQHRVPQRREDGAHLAFCHSHCIAKSTATRRHLSALHAATRYGRLLARARMHGRFLRAGARVGSRLAVRPRGGGHHRSACAASFQVAVAPHFEPVVTPATLSALATTARCVGVGEEGAHPRARAGVALFLLTRAIAAGASAVTAVGVGGDDDDGR